jgi:hypothetical protein
MMLCFLEGLALVYAPSVVSKFLIRVLKMGHPLQSLRIVDKIWNLVENNFVLL